MISPLFQLEAIRTRAEQEGGALKDGERAYLQVVSDLEEATKKLCCAENDFVKERERCEGERVRSDGLKKQCEELRGEVVSHCLFFVCVTAFGKNKTCKPSKFVRKRERARADSLKQQSGDIFAAVLNCCLPCSPLLSLSYLSPLSLFSLLFFPSVSV